MAGQISTRLTLLSVAGRNGKTHNMAQKASVCKPWEGSAQRVGYATA
jgi:hypothetical protein